MNESDIPVVQTARLTLRAFAADDLDPLCMICSDRDVIRYMIRTEPWPKEIVQRWIDRHHEHWQQYGFGWWAVALRTSGELIGWCGLNVLDGPDESGETEVLYLFGKPFWGKGLATEAARRSVEYGFEDVGLDEIVGLALPGNRASQRVLEKSGLVFRNQAHYFGVDLLRYTLNREQFDSLD